MAVGVSAQNTPNARQARQIFDKTYQMVFGPQGCTLRYDVNIIGVFKTNGTIWYKGKKSKFIEPHSTAWNDGVTYTLVEPKKKTVTIYGANDKDRDKYASKFTFNPDDFNYSIAAQDDGYLITLKAKPGAKGIKEARALIDKKTRHPKSLRIKLGFIWTTVAISNFKSGGIADDVFVFPRSQYSSYKFIDKRK